MQQPDYRKLKAAIETPRPRTLGEWQLIEMLLPHTAEEASGEWATPTSEGEVAALVERLGRHQRTLCGLTAGERFLLPMWLEHAVDLQLEMRQIGSVPAGLELIRQWLWGRIDADNRKLILPLIQESIAAIERRSPRAEIHARAEILAGAMAEFVANPGPKGTRRIVMVGHRLQYWHDLPVEAVAMRRRAYLRAWWAHCRCRLAFANAAAAKLQ